MKSLKFLFVIVLSLLVFSCKENQFFNSIAGSENSSGDDFSVVSWNVQTFFDGEKNGCEYSEFQKSGNWNREKYQVRLQRLCEVMKELNADVFVLIEIENQGIVQDISNFLAGSSWKGKQLWQYSCFSKPEGTGIGIAIVSKYELKDFSTHGMDIRILNEEQPSVRYLLQVTMEIKGKEVVLFANHWKSMSEGETETEIWRDWQESVLAGRVMEAEKDINPSAVLICGDFNRDVNSFVTGDFGLMNNKLKANLLLRNAGFGESKSVAVYSPWIENQSFSSTTGSYFYQNRWSRIDHIMLYGNGEITSFEPVSRSPWSKDDKTPFSYKLSTGEGYSDHLPLLVKLRL